MKSKHPFSIIYRPPETPKARQQATVSLSSVIRKTSRTLAQATGSLPPALIEALLSNVSRPGSNAAAALPAELVEVAKKAAHRTDTVTVGLLDLGAWVSRLPQLLRTMNKAQDKFVFLELLTPVPAGLIKARQHLLTWAAEHLGRPLDQPEEQDLTQNMLADEFYYFAEALRKEKQLDIVIGLTSDLIAFIDEETNRPEWNYYCVGMHDVAVVSTFEVREFSALAGRPYEAAVGMLIAGQVVALRNGFEYHQETRGCVFDFNVERADLITSIKAMRIEPECMNLIVSAREADAARLLVAALARMRGGPHD